MSEVTSLKSTIAYRLIVPVIIFIILETALSYYVTLHYVEKTYDKWLLDSAHSLVQEVEVNENKITVNLSAATLKIFKWDDVDTTYFKINTESKRLIVGDRVLPDPLQPISTEQPVYSVIKLNGKVCRMVSLQVPGNMPEKVFIHVAETLNKRQNMMIDSLLADLIPQIVLTLLISLLIYEAIIHGLKPLDKLANDISQRSPSDLSPISDAYVCEEVKTLTDTTNDLLAKLSASIASQQRFIANAAHQLRTPLAGLRLQAERAQREDEIDDMLPALSQIQNSADSISHMITQLLVLARSGPIEGSYQFDEIDLQTLVRAVCTEWVPKALENNMELSLDAPANPIFMKGDSVLLSELLANLLDNAINYGNKQGHLLVTLVYLPVPCLTIEDDGPGIAEAEYKKVFERFYRVPGSVGQGCGLGLAIVKEIADLHNINLKLGKSANGGVRIDLLFDQSERE